MIFLCERQVLYYEVCFVELFKIQIKVKCHINNIMFYYRKLVVNKIKFIIKAIKMSPKVKYI